MPLWKWSRSYESLGKFCQCRRLEETVGNNLGWGEGGHWEGSPGSGNAGCRRQGSDPAVMPDLSFASWVAGSSLWLHLSTSTLATSRSGLSSSRPIELPLPHISAAATSMLALNTALVRQPDCSCAILGYSACVVCLLLCSSNLTGKCISEGVDFTGETCTCKKEMAFLLHLSGVICRLSTVF